MGPAISAIVATAVFTGKSGLVDLSQRVINLKMGGIWYLVVLGSVLLIGFGLLTSSKPEDFLTYSGAGNWGLLVIPYVFILNGFGEEIGWRGLLVDELLKKYSLGVTAVLSWVVWGIWHIPLFWIVMNFLNLGIGGTVGWTLGLLAGSVFLTWMYARSKRSILLLAAWHTVFNFATATTATAGVGAALSSTLVMIVAIVILVLPSTWIRPNRSGQSIL
jgi:membrane protease YdiL (CAAX protease family)